MVMNRYFRNLLLIISIFQGFFAAAYLLQLPFAVQMWPFPDTTPMTFIFVSSIFAAAVASTFWAVLSKEYATLAGIALDYLTIFAPMAIFSFQVGSTTGSDALMAFGVSCAIGAIFGLGLFVWSQRIPVRDPRPQPHPVRWSFMFFTVALVLAGGALVLKTPNILPWTLTPELSVVCGWIFLGAATYFAYSLYRPSWANTAGQLAGFLAYDVILIVPFLQRLPTIAPQFQFGLYFYTVVVTYSGLLAIYYLFISPATRIWGSRSALAGQLSS
jgi:hypothetical protein